MPATPKFTADGDIPYITSKNIKGGHIDFSKIKKISKESFLDISKNRPIVKDDILISMIGTIGEVARVKDSDLDFYGQNMYLVRLDQEKINVGYFLHFFDSKKMKNYFSSIKNNSSQGYLKAGQIESLKIPVPSLPEQERIVSMLDKFDALVNNISIGLPAEIKARRSQYEYYRGKLLTFNEYAN
jgi:type I restriction enzyme S subunit